MLARFDGECNLIRVARSEFRRSEIERRDWIENAAASTSGAASCSLRAAATTFTTAKGPGAA